MGRGARPTVRRGARRGGSRALPGQLRADPAGGDGLDRCRAAAGRRALRGRAHADGEAGRRVGLGAPGPARRDRRRGRRRGRPLRRLRGAGQVPGRAGGAARGQPGGGPPSATGRARSPRWRSACASIVPSDRFGIELPVDGGKLRAHVLRTRGRRGVRRRWRNCRQRAPPVAGPRKPSSGSSRRPGTSLRAALPGHLRGHATGGHGVALRDAAAKRRALPRRAVLHGGQKRPRTPTLRRSPARPGGGRGGGRAGPLPGLRGGPEPPRPAGARERLPPGGDPPGAPLRRDRGVEPDAPRDPSAGRAGRADRHDRAHPRRDRDRARS